MLNSLLVRRKNKLIVPAGDSKNDEIWLTKALNINLMSLGHAMSPALFHSVKRLSYSEVIKFAEQTITDVRQMIGAHVAYKPLFRNFPNDIPDTNEYFCARIEGWLKGMFHRTKNGKQLSCGCMIDPAVFDLSNFGACPICQCQVSDSELLEAQNRPASTEIYKINFLDIGTQDDAASIFKNLLSSKTSISDTDKGDLKILVKHFGEKSPEFITEIPHKEILAHTAKLFLEAGLPTDCFKIKTMTDVLRVATALSDGDVSLAENTKFISFNRKTRRFLLNLAENCGNKEEDIVRHRGRWIRLAERLHPGEYYQQYPNFYDVITKVRNNEDIVTFNSITDKLLKSQDSNALATHLSFRPTEFARRLDYMLAHSEDVVARNIITKFGKLAEKVPTPTLLQVQTNFRVRSQENKHRVILPKGNLAKIKLLDEVRSPLSKKICDAVESCIESQLVSRFAKQPFLGKVYISQSLRNHIVPASQRSASKVLKTITRGSKADLDPDKNTVRFFIYWKEPKNQRTDIDLSAGLFDADWNMVDSISFRNYHAVNCKHSGDIQSAPDGAAEFIDIDKQSALKHKIRYVSMSIYSYTGQPLVDLPECFAGFMNRENPKSGEIFDPKSVVNKFDLTADTNSAIPLFLDLLTNQMIWADLSTGGKGAFGQINFNNKSLGAMGRAIASMSERKPNLYDLLKLHVEARGVLAEAPSEADLVFDETNICYEIDRIMSEFLA